MTDQPVTGALNISSPIIEVIKLTRTIATPTHEVEILRGIDLTIRKGEVHAIMGRNGSGKTTLAYALMGHPAYEVTKGEVLWKGRDLLKLSPDKRSRLGSSRALRTGAGHSLGT